MVLVPEYTFNNIKQNDNNVKDGLTKQINEFKAALQSIMDNDFLPAETQMKLYSQVFAQYSKLVEDRNQPPLVLFKKDESEAGTFHQEDISENEMHVYHDDEEDEDNWPLMATLLIPKTKKKHAGLLTDFLKNSANFKVNHNGEIFIDNMKVPDSHFTDLVHDFIRDRPKMVPSTGYEKFAKFLVKLNTPRTFIGNPEMWNLMQQLKHKHSVQKDGTPSIKRKRPTSFNLYDSDQETLTKLKRPLTYEDF